MNIKYFTAGNKRVSCQNDSSEASWTTVWNHTHTHTLTHNKVSFTDIWSSFKLREISTTAASCVRPPTPPCWLPTSYKVPQYSDLYKSVHVLLNIWIYTEVPPTVVTANKTPDIDVHSRPHLSSDRPLNWNTNQRLRPEAKMSWSMNDLVFENRAMVQPKTFLSFCLLHSWDRRLRPWETSGRLLLQVPVLPKTFREAGAEDRRHPQDRADVRTWTHTCSHCGPGQRAEVRGHSDP